MNNTVFYSVIVILLALIAFFGNRMVQNGNITEIPTEETIEITMYRGEGCQCCIKWADYLETEGFTVKDRLVDNLNEVKSDHQIPSELASCHTAIVDGYVVEGHVPAEDIRRLIHDQPEATGISVPGMPMGSPGMEGYRKDSYNVVLFDKAGNRSVYAHH